MSSLVLRISRMSPSRLLRSKDAKKTEVTTHDVRPKKRQKLRQAVSLAQAPRTAANHLKPDTHTGAPAPEPPVPPEGTTQRIPAECPAPVRSNAPEGSHNLLKCAQAADWPISGAGPRVERMDREGGMGNAKGGAFQPGILGRLRAPLGDVETCSGGPLLPLVVLKGEGAFGETL